MWNKIKEISSKDNIEEMGLLWLNPINSKTFFSSDSHVIPILSVSTPVYGRA